MPDLLLYVPDSYQAAQLEQLGRDSGFRVKNTQIYETAVDWLGFKSFEALLLDSRTPLDQQQKLADLLWNGYQAARFIVCDFDKSDKSKTDEVRLYGAEIISGSNLSAELKKLLLETVPRIARGNQDFKIMVVEDLDAPRDIICSFVEGMGYSSVSGLPSAKNALQQLQQNPTEFSCILTDIRMPEISGEEFIRQVRLDPRLKHLPIIVLTAHGTVDCLIACLKAGASGFLVKPPRKKDLQRELGRALRINTYATSPRLASDDEVEQMREMLIEKGF